MKISYSTTIHAPISHVFRTFTDLSKAKHHLSGIKELKIIKGSERMSVGTTWEETRTMMGKDSTETMWVSELQENQSYTVEAASHGTKYTSVFTFKEKEGRTEVTWIFEGIPQTLPAKLMSVLGYIFSGSLKKMLAQDMDELKTACEEDSGAKSD